MSAADDHPRHHRVAIIGSGFGGLGLAISLTQRGITDFVVFERGGDVGGTWRDNTYPGAACDVPSQLYSYSFAPNPEWTQSFSAQPEIQRYILDLTERYGIRARTLLDCPVTAAVWNAAGYWDITTADGHHTADVLVSAAGPLSTPKLPDIKGISSFKGRLFHSAQWDHDYDLTGKRVAVIGTGASAIQIVPSIAGQVAHLDLYQRSAPWVLPRVGHRYTALERLLYRRSPAARRLARTGVYWLRESMVLWQVKYPPLADLIGMFARIRLRWKVRDPELRRKVTPTHRLGCKRMLISNDYYPALLRDNVDVITDGIAEVREHSILGEDGVERDLDAIVLATGFKIADSPTFDLITGADGTTLAETFQTGGLTAYKGTAVSGFPNLFAILGPNSALSYTSAVFTIECQIAYILDAIDTIAREGLAGVNVRPETQTAYNRDLREKFEDTVWTDGCTSWFVDEEGRHAALWPDFSFRFRKALERFDIDAYEVTRKE